MMQANMMMMEDEGDIPLMSSRSINSNMRQQQQQSAVVVIQPLPPPAYVSSVSSNHTTSIDNADIIITRNQERPQLQCKPISPNMNNNQL
jgi:hypothetical protein